MLVSDGRTHEEGNHELDAGPIMYNDPIITYYTASFILNH